MISGPRKAVCSRALGRPSKGWLAAFCRQKIRSQVRVDMWKRLGVTDTGRCRMKCAGVAGGPAVTDFSGLIIQMAKLRG